jgi:dipeptidyl aminopeptidase/acylaminoacyl peptidase
VRLEKRGKYARLYVGGSDGWRFTGAAQPVEFTEPFYVGIGICSHNKDVVETAVFSEVQLGAPPTPAGKPVLYSALETQSLASTDRRVCFVTPTRIEAPNWYPDGRRLLYNSGGRLYRIPVEGGTPEVVDTGFAVRCNNDHGISPDGRRIAISDQSREQGQSLIYTLPIEGGAPTRITSNGPSYWHGWSPDGKTLAYCAQRNGAFDIYVIPAEGGAETRLTTAEGLDDGPECSPDGRYIYFNSERTGRMQIWRMKADGSDQVQVTRDDANNWFPHLSPDGAKIVFLTTAARSRGTLRTRMFKSASWTLRPERWTFSRASSAGKGR